jgi:putative tryptophan/tyrosine transport system substrate-binding protein
MPKVLGAGETVRRRMPRIGVLVPSTPGATEQSVEAFKQGLREHGYVEEQNIIVELRYGEARGERLSDLAAELVRMMIGAHRHLSSARSVGRSRDQ